jgi:glycine dehydrogenase subunit 1
MRDGSPYAPQDSADREAICATLGIDSPSELFDIPSPVTFDGSLELPARSEAETRRHVGELLDQNEDVERYLGRGHYDQYVPAVVDDLAGRSEFLTSYTQYQPEVAQGFLQALFEYQSMLVELTGLEVANCSMYDGATALGEAVTLSQRAREVSGQTVLLPAHLREDTRSVVENYAAGADVTVETYPMDDGAVDIDALEGIMDSDVAMVYAANPTIRGVIQPQLGAVGERTEDHDALFCLGSDPVALALLESPASLGADIVVGEASTLGNGTAYGMGLGLFVTREAYLRQVPGRLVGAGEAADGRRAYTLTLQTREQHIRRERATSNICTNQAWVALRVAMHAALLGPDGLVSKATACVQRARELADRINALDGITAPVHDRHHFREFVARTASNAFGLKEMLASRGVAVHALDENHLQICVTQHSPSSHDAFIAALREVIQ